MKVSTCIKLGEVRFFYYKGGCYKLYIRRYSGVYDFPCYYEVIASAGSLSCFGNDFHTWGDCLFSGTLKECRAYCVKFLNRPDITERKE